MPHPTAVLDARAAPGDSTPIKPRLRGVLHQWAFFASLVLGTALVMAARAGRPQLGAAIYASALAGLLGASALYHRGNWRPAVRRWLRRLDHTMIFVLIAGTYTPVALVALSHRLATALLAIVWAAAGAAALVNLVWVSAPKWVVAGACVAVGWVAVAAIPQLFAHGRGTSALLLLAGGLLYTIGATIYARHRPNPVPLVFGYHELFHLLTILATIAHFTAVSLLVLPSQSI